MLLGIQTDFVAALIIILLQNVNIVPRHAVVFVIAPQVHQIPLQQLRVPIIVHRNDF